MRPYISICLTLLYSYLCAWTFSYQHSRLFYDGAGEKRGCVVDVAVQLYHSMHYMCSRLSYVCRLYTNARFFEISIISSSGFCLLFFLMECRFFFYETQRKRPRYDNDTSGGWINVGRSNVPIPSHRSGMHDSPIKGIFFFQLIYCTRTSFFFPRACCSRNASPRCSFWHCS